MRVFLSPRVMDGPVDFDNQAHFVAIEVDDEAINYLLTSKVQPIESIGFQSSPEERFL